MATTKTSASKKLKKVYESIKSIKCDRCGVETTHTLFDYDLKLYKCNTCGTIYTKVK